MNSSCSGWGSEENILRDPSSDCWSVVVHLDHVNIDVKKRNAFISFVRSVTAKVDTGQNVRYCLHGFEKLFSFLWNFLRSIFIMITSEVLLVALLALLN